MWFVWAGCLVIAELFTGTFYLLMISIGLAAGGLAALLGVGSSSQMVTAGVVSVIAILALRRTKFALPSQTDASSDPNVNMDVGQKVTVDNWNVDDTARVMYRGAQWDVDLAAGERPVPGVYIIKEVQGSRLIVRRA
ncbi:NfeD family protein [Undibacterium arcticum]|uniref:NfeD family protein n=1 Tax=Undibacterium arcticum TaxID=1762892 RepID=A0ABV7F5M6_9BURK